MKLSSSCRRCFNSPLQLPVELQLTYVCMSAVPHHLPRRAQNPPRRMGLHVLPRRARGRDCAAAARRQRGGRVPDGRGEESAVPGCGAGLWEWRHGGGESVDCADQGMSLDLGVGGGACWGTDGACRTRCRIYRGGALAPRRWTARWSGRRCALCLSA